MSFQNIAKQAKKIFLPILKIGRNFIFITSLEENFINKTLLA
jgi:hypothetical protein